jgi:hypothetical protein
MIGTSENQLSPHATKLLSNSDQLWGFNAMSGFDQSSPPAKRIIEGETTCQHLTWSWGWTIEDEQCQRIGGGYAAKKFGFLLFLGMEPRLSTPVQSPAPRTMMGSRHKDTQQMLAERTIENDS